MPEDTILATRDRHIATVTLNRPHKLNAFTRPMWNRLGVVIRELSADDTVRCIVIRGAGGKAFSPGNDISEFETERSNKAQARDYGRDISLTLTSLSECRHPIVALIEGICVGGGLEVAAHCDIRICGESSRFGVPIKRLGLVLAYPEIAGLLKLVGPATVMEILLEGRIFTAAEALERGLVTRAVADGKVEDEAFASARNIAEGAPLVARWHKKFARRLMNNHTPLRPEELDEGYACYETEDFQIGYKSFLAKTKPDFKGR